VTDIEQLRRRRWARRGGRIRASRISPVSASVRPVGRHEKRLMGPNRAIELRRALRVVDRTVDDYVASARIVA